MATPPQGPLTQNHNLLSQVKIQPGDADSIPPIHDYSPSMSGISPKSPTFDEHLNTIIGRSVSDPTLRETYPELKDSDLSQGYADGGSVQDPTTARLHHIVFVKPLDQIGPEDHDFINSLIQKGQN